MSSEAQKTLLFGRQRTRTSRVSFPTRIERSDFWFFCVDIIFDYHKNPFASWVRFKNVIVLFERSTREDGFRKHWGDTAKMRLGSVEANWIQHLYAAWKITTWPSHGRERRALMSSGLGIGISVWVFCIWVTETHLNLVTPGFKSFSHHACAWYFTYKFRAKWSLPHPHTHWHPRGARG